MLTIDKKVGIDTRIVFTHVLADIPNGVIVKGVEGKVLYSGTPIGVDDNGDYRVIKTAGVYAGAIPADNTHINLIKGSAIAVGDVVYSDAYTGKSAIVTALASTHPDYDVIAVDDAVGGDLIALGIKAIAVAKAKVATGSVPKYVPVALVLEDYDVVKLSNTFVATCTIGQLYAKSAPQIPESLKRYLPTIKFI